VRGFVLAQSPGPGNAGGIHYHKRLTNAHGDVEMKPLSALSNRFALLLALAMLSAASHAVAGWNGAPEAIERHPTWIYTPATTMANGKRVLMIALHGCAQSPEELRRFGNFDGTAEANAMVVALPAVGDKVFFGNPAAKCWDYHGANDTQGHMMEIVRLAQSLLARPELGIDPANVYIVGLSSGAALALAIACRAPDVFAGVGAIAGPSVGSSQFSALAEAGAIPATNVDDAVNRCRALAGDKSAFLDTQIASIAYGDMDLNGAHEKHRVTSLSDAERARHAGQLALVSTRWSIDNARVLQRIYDAGPPAAAEPVQAGMGSQQVARRNGKPRVALLAMRDLGHAWPAGSGKPNDAASGGLWMAQRGLNYPEYAAGWLIANNLRVGAGLPQPVPPPTARCISDNNFNHVQQGRAVLCNLGFSCAKGSGDNLGLFNIFVHSSLEESSPGYFRKTVCR
jgi:poly(3-hydroxybutyrate) depolymerase